MFRSPDSYHYTIIVTPLKISLALQQFHVERSLILAFGNSGQCMQLTKTFYAKFILAPKLAD